MGEGRTSVILQRAKHRIGVDVVTGSDQKTAAIIAAQVVAERCHCAVCVINVRASSSGVEDCVPDRQRRAALDGLDADAPVIVAAEGAAGDSERCVATEAVVKDAAAVVASRVAANCAVGDSQCRAAEMAVAADPAAVPCRQVAAQRAVGDGERRAAARAVVKDARAVRGCGVAAQRAVVHAERRAAATFAVIEDTAASHAAGRVAAERAVEDSERRVAGGAVVKDAATIKRRVATQSTLAHCQDRVVVINAAAIRREGRRAVCDGQAGDDNSFA